MHSADQPSTLRSGTSHDVIVVGARAAGAATAMPLTRRALRTRLLDASALGSDTVSTHALMRGRVRQLSRWDLHDGTVDAGTPAVHWTTFRFRSGDRGRVAALEPDAVS
jgi:2-polyprenyl-6-methoxyphenol hydroxylase-like FAD-dependent oxidoreductase